MAELPRARSLRTVVLIGLVLAVAIGVIGYVQIAVKRLEEGLPLRVMAEKRDMERVARNYYELLAATKPRPGEPNQRQGRRVMPTREEELLLKPGRMPAVAISEQGASS